MARRNEKVHMIMAAVIKVHVKAVTRLLTGVTAL